MNKFKRNERKSLMTIMRYSGMTLQEVGDKFGVTREYVRQVVGSSNKRQPKAELDNALMVAKIVANPDLTRDEAAEKFGVSPIIVTSVSVKNGIRRPIGNEDSPAFFGEKWEQWFIEQLLERDIPAEWCDRRRMPYDLIANGYKIDVKASDSPTIPPSQKRLVSPRWSFHLNKHKDDEPIDFFVCIAITESAKDVFIIPFSALPKTKIWLQMCWPTLRPEIGKYQKYHNRYDLLRRKS